MARKHRLPTAIQAFIPAHHGTMLISITKLISGLLNLMKRVLLGRYQIFATLALFPSRGKRGL